MPGCEQSFAKRLGRLLRAWRKRKGYKTLKQFSEATGIPYQELSTYEIGKRVPRAERLASIARILGVSADELLGLTPPSLDDAVPPDEPDEGAPREVGAAAPAGVGDTHVGGVGGMAARAANDVGEGEGHPQTMPVDGATREVA